MRELFWCVTVYRLDISYFFLRSTIGGGSVCGRFKVLRHLGSHILSSGVQVHASYFRVSIIHRTLDMDYMIFNVRTFLCLRVHTGAGGTSTSQHTILTRKHSHNCFLCSALDSNLWSLAFMYLYSIFNCNCVCPFLSIFVLSGIETPDRNGQWYQHLITQLFAFVFCFTRAIPKGLTFGLCLYVLRVCNVHVLYSIQLVRDLKL